MRIIQTTNQFDRDFKHILKSGDKDNGRIKDIMSRLANDEQL